MTKQQFSTIVHVIAAVAAIVGWLFSATFSTAGFATTAPGFEWIGVLLTFLVTALEIIFNEEGAKHKPVILISCLLAYAFDIITNAIFLWVAQGSQPYQKNPLVLVMPATIGSLLAFLPEALLQWALLGSSGSDTFKTLKDAFKPNVQQDSNLAPKPARDVTPRNQDTF